jgi:hypothetical protein
METKRGRGNGKAIKTSSARNPPDLKVRHAEIDQWIRRGIPDLQPLVTALDALICESIPKLEFAIKWQKAYYGLAPQGWIIELAAYQISANVVFFGGAEFDPPPPLGDEGRSRYVKVRTLQEANDPQLCQWIKQAARVRGWK